MYINLQNETFSRYLASGDTMVSLSYSFRVGKSTTTEIIRDTVEAIVAVLSPKVLKIPNEDDWKNISDGFNERWNFPHCCGAIDGKHVSIIVRIFKAILAPHFITIRIFFYSFISSVRL